jgi:hypothetical protein
MIPKQAYKQLVKKPPVQYVPLSIYLIRRFDSNYSIVRVVTERL